MLPRRGIIIAHMLAAALALAAAWRPRGCRLACTATNLPHAPISRNERGLYLKLEQRSTNSKHNPSTISCNATTGAPGAALPGREMAATAADAGAGLRSEFLEVLLSRRRDLQVPLLVEQGIPVKNPLYQKPLGPKEAVPMESCPSKEVENFKEKLVEENFYLITEGCGQISASVIVSDVREKSRSFCASE